MGDLFFEESNVSQNKGNNSQAKSDGGSSSGIVEINSWLHNGSSRNLNATNKDNIANSRWLVNQKKNFSLVGLGEIEGTINTAANQPADKLTNKSETTDLKAGFIESTGLTVSEWKYAVNRAELEDIKVNWWVVNFRCGRVIL